MKITTPKDMLLDLRLLESAIRRFENQLKDEPKSIDYYQIAISGILNKETRKEIERLYTKAGWYNVKCRIIYYNGKSHDLTRLVLNRNDE